MCANSEGSGETARMRRLAWAFAGRLCDKYHNLMSWLILFQWHHLGVCKAYDAISAYKPPKQLLDTFLKLTVLLDVNQNF